MVDKMVKQKNMEYRNYILRI